MGLRLTSIFTIALLGLFFSTPAEARCACTCVEGAVHTLCTSAEEASANPNFCANSTLECAVIPPQPPVEDTTEVTPPEDGTANCRTVTVEGLGSRNVCEITAKRDEKRAKWAEKEGKWAEQEARWETRMAALAVKNPRKYRELMAKTAEKRAKRDERRAKWLEREARWADKLGES